MTEAGRGSLYVVAYDIEDDRVRSKVATVLEGTGVRVQKSVFECRLTPAALERLEARLRRVLGRSGGAAIRVYRLCQGCSDASFGLGEVDEAKGPEPWPIV